MFPYDEIQVMNFWQEYQRNDDISSCQEAHDTFYPLW